MTIKEKAAVFLVLFVGIFLLPLPLVGEKTKICLTMIVKNEAKIIERCLNSVNADCISICDTGSSDNTVELIEKFMKEKGIPGRIYRHDWKNFGHNRTLSAEAAQRTLKELGFSLQNTYLLFLDADMMLEVSPEFSKDSLKEDCYSIAQKNASQSYYNTRLVRASLPWKCIGVTHEYWSCQQPCRQSILDTLTIDDRNDGGCKSDKFERDIRLLTEGLEKEPDNERYMFYLAQSHRCLGNYDDAIKWYKARIEKGGWNEEVWYSKFMIGQCYEEMGEWDQALLVYLDAYQFNQKRAEPLQQISTYYRTKGQHNLAYMFAKQGAAIPYPKDQVLFISYPVYDYLFDQDLSISAYYTPFREEGYAATDRLILKKNVPQHIKEQAYRNMLFYVQNLKNIEYIPIDIELPSIREGLASHYNPMNPSIRKTEEGYEVICRTVNYLQIGAKHFKSLDLFDPTNTVKTRNFFVKYDRNLVLQSQQEIVENLVREKKKIFNIEGLEDCRFCEFDKGIWFTCTTLDTNPFGQPQISLCKLEDAKSGSTIKVEQLFPLFGPNPRRCEKNWLPFVKDKEFHVIYSYDPFTIYKPNLKFTNRMLTRDEIGFEYIPEHDFSRFSGSAPPIEFDGGYLLLIHETVYNEQRNYMHRFLYLDPTFHIKKISKPFSFLHLGIEYCCGMTVDHSGSKLILAIGIEDREAYLGIIDLNMVRSLLEPLP